jgi:hypothetical protein
MDQSKEPVAEESQSPVQKQSSSIKLPPTTVFAVDDIIAGRYKVVALLGRGGMGCVYRVQQIFLRKEYALKTLSPTDAGTKAETSWRRFQKEAQAASALDHPCLIKVHDFGTDDGQPFFVMDFFDGETLSERIKREGALTLETAIAVFSKICQGLSYAHSQGIVHRDIKPSNIMISRGTSLEVRIVDFGIAKFNDTEDIDLISLTKTGEVFGTPYFMSPEQCMGKSTDHRSDIYSLGCLIYESLTGAPPFFGANALMIMMQHQNDNVPSLKEASLGKSFPESLDSVIAKMMAKEPEQRYQDLLAVSADLERIRQGKEVVVSSSAVLSRLSGAPRPVFVVILFMVILLSATAYVIGRFHGAPKTVSPTITEEKPKVATARPASSSGYYSLHPDPHTRVFVFPSNPEESPGLLILAKGVHAFGSTNQADKWNRISAIGDITLDPFKPFGLRVGLEAADDVFKHFRPDELNFVCLRNVWLDPQPDTFKSLVRLVSLEALDFSETKSLTEKEIDQLNQLPKLVSVDSGNNGLTGGNWLRLKRLPQLKQLSLRALKDARLVLPRLAETATIEDLNLRDTELTPQDYDIIGKLKKLRSLDLSETGLNDELMPKLLALKHLEELTLPDHITAACIPYFKKMHLKILRSDRWLMADQDRLRAALPGCQVTSEGYTWPAASDYFGTAK